MILAGRNGKSKGRGGGAKLARLPVQARAKMQPAELLPSFPSSFRPIFHLQPTASFLTSIPLASPGVHKAPFTCSFQ